MNAERIEAEKRSKEVKYQTEEQKLKAKADERRRRASFDEKNYQLQLETQGYTNALLDKQNEIENMKNLHTLNQEKIEQKKKQYVVDWNYNRMCIRNNCSCGSS